MKMRWSFVTNREEWVLKYSINMWLLNMSLTKYDDTKEAVIVNYVKERVPENRKIRKGEDKILRWWL